MMDIFSKIKGKVVDYDVLVIGHLKWNPYFDETADLPPRGDPSTCTSTMIRGIDESGMPYVLIVDPTLRQKAEDYYFDINRRTGLKAEDVTHCFITHAHYDHQVGVNYFPNATWYAAIEVSEELKRSVYMDGNKVIGVSGEFLPGVCIIPLPGHTLNLHGVAFLLDGQRIVVAGDGVMTKNHFINSTSMYEADSKIAAITIEMLKRTADVIVPGHDNAILNKIKSNVVI